MGYGAPPSFPATSGYLGIAAPARINTAGGFSHGAPTKARAAAKQQQARNGAFCR
jgi:hypothetical protein